MCTAAYARRSRIGGVAASIWLLAGGLPAIAEPPADLAAVMPEHAVVCLTWAGAESWGEAAKDTSVGKTLAEPDVRAFVDLALKEAADALRRKLGERGGVLAQVAEPLISFGGSLWRRPWAAAILDEGGSGERPQIVFVMRPGKDAAMLRQTVDRIVGLARKADAAIRPLAEQGGGADWSTLRTGPAAPLVAWNFSKEYFALAIGREAAEALAASLAGGTHLADQAEYKAVGAGLGAANGGQVASLYVDARRLLALMGPKGGQAAMPQVMLARAFGVDSVSGIGASIRLADGGYRSSLYLHAPRAHRGLLQLFDQPALRDDDFLVVPKDALFAYVSNMDLAGLFGAAAGDSAASAPSEGMAINPLALLPGASAWVPSLMSLFSSLGDTWAVFVPPDSGVFLTGLTVCVEVKDADKARRSLAELVDKLGPQFGEAALRTRKARYGTNEVTYVQTHGRAMPFAPAWGVGKERLVIGLYPQYVAATLARIEGGTPREASILSNTEFVAGRKRLPGDANAVTYFDTRRAMGDLYDFALPAVQASLATMQSGASSLDIAALPLRASVVRHIFASMSATRSDANGILMVSHTSLPIVNPSIAEAVVLAPAIFGVAEPLLSHAERTADRRASLARLKELGMACQAYSTAHEDRLPTELEQLAPHLRHGKADLVSPNEKAGRVSYRLLTGFPASQRVTQAAERVLIYEAPALFGGEGTCVLYADGHSQWRAAQAFHGDLEATKRYLAKKE